MNKLNKLALLTIAGMTICNIITPAKLETAVVVAAQTKSIEQEMFDCVKGHIKNFDDLTIMNVKSKKVHIEKMRKELLSILVEAGKIQKHKYANLEKMLNNLDINQVLKAIADFKEILKHLPADSSLLIKNNLKDSTTKRLLGF